jgi:signal transduction histidine kinase/CheY-like chemotaxis protein
LRQFWHGPLICYCDNDEQALSAVETARGLAILPPYTTRQVVNALRLFLQLSIPFATLFEKEAQPPQAAPTQAEQALYESERRLEQAQRMEAVGRLAGGIAHDFNNLLTVIGSYSDLAIRKLEDGHIVLRYVDQIRKASATAATLTRQLLAFSRRQVLQPRVIALNEIVDEISFMVQSLLGAGIELKLRLDPNLGQLEADPVQLQQVLLNLIVNAKDAMPDGGLLSIETRNFDLDARYCKQSSALKAGSYVRLTVADTGMGMDEETLARIYEPFFTTKPKGRGTGLGLPTVYGIVQQSGGQIAVYSEIGKGTTFHIYLPRVDKTMEHEGAVEESFSLLSGQETILLVEDEQGVRELATTILQEAGYRLLTAATPEEAMALEIGYEGEIDLLLTDVIMPRMTGREVAIQLARRRPQIPVVYMSGYTEDVMAFQQLLEIGAYLIEKPFYPNDLLRMVRRAIEQPAGHEVTTAVYTR